MAMSVTSLRKMENAAVEMIGGHRAAGATLFPVRAKHEMVDDELASAVEKGRESFLSARGIEDVVLLDFDPGQLAALGAERVAQMGEFFLLRQEFLASRKPVCSRHGFRIRYLDSAHDDFSFGLGVAKSLTALCLARSNLTRSAVTPPVEVAPAIISARVPKHSGHIGSSFVGPLHGPMPIASSARKAVVRRRWGPNLQALRH